MDKKNTMLLTVIAVATLLVAVVGATFAYFAIGATAENNAKTTITGGTEGADVGSVALKGASSLKLKLSAEDMSLANKGYYYYASATANNAKSTTNEAKDAEKNKVTVATASLTGGSAGIIYSCVADYKITIDPTDIEFNDKDEAELYLYADEGKITLSGGFDATPIKLSDLNELTTTGKTGKVTFKLTGTGSPDVPVDVELKAALQIRNSEEDQADEDRLTGKSFSVVFEATTFNCDTVAS